MRFTSSLGSERGALPSLDTVHDEGAVRSILNRLNEVGGEITFPVAPLPVLVPRYLVNEMLTAVRAYFGHLRRPSFLKRSRSWVPSDHRAAGALAAPPALSQFDFALTSTPSGEIRPHLVECQGISSLMGFVPLYGQLLADALAPDHTPLLAHSSLEEYAGDLRRVLGGAWLIDVAVSEQRLRADFWILRHLVGVEIKDLTSEVVRDVEAGDPLLYSRIVPPEARRKGVLHIMQRLFARPRRWVYHPDWYYAMSKRLLPELSLSAPLVPESALLTPESAKRWAGREDVVLKPTDDYGGTGVILDPLEEDLRAALAAPEPYILQRRVPLERLVTVPNGEALFCELRVLCLDDRPCALFCRLAHDPIVSIARNAAFPWCGITAGLVPKS